MSYIEVMTKEGVDKRIGEVQASLDASRLGAEAATAEARALLTSLSTVEQETRDALALVLNASNVKRYSTSAARQADTPPDGTWGWAADTGDYLLRQGGAWVSVTPASKPTDTGDFA